MTQKMRKIKQSEAKSERGFRPSPRTKSSNNLVKKNAQIKQSQGESEQGFDLCPSDTPDKINRNQATQ
jgi:hypothetical protein